MKQKVFIILALIYSVQLIISCCPNETINYTLTDLTSRNLVLEGNSFVEVASTDTVNKEDLLLEVIFTGEQTVTDLMKDVKKLGVQSAYAAIDCFQDINYINRVASMEVFAIDVSDNSEVNVTNDIIVDGGLSISDYIQQFNPTVNDGLLIDFNETSNLPSQAQFRISVSLDDNTDIETITNQVNFN